jgi:3-phenylpropionate/trans-cinnamate dioxygenase ferredoxin reductase component
VCERWLEHHTPIEDVLQQLSLANFDPEFFDEYESFLVQQYNQINNKQLKLTAKRSLNKVLAFLNLAE